MDEIKCNCAKCEIAEKICRLEKGKGPAWRSWSSRIRSSQFLVNPPAIIPHIW